MFSRLGDAPVREQRWTGPR